MNPSDAWTITNTQFDARRRGQFNSVFTISNGYLGLTGHLQEDRDGSCPVTLINGVYDELDMFSLIRASNEERPYLDPRHFDGAGRSPAVANLPDPLYVRVFVGDREISLGRGSMTGFGQSLDMRRGVYSYSFDYTDAAGRTSRIMMMRLACLQHPHRVFMRYRVTPLNHSAPIRVLSGINAAVHSNVTRERQFSVVQLAADPPDRCILHVRTPARQHDVHEGVVNVLRDRSGLRSCRGVCEHNAVYTLYEFEPQAGDPITIDRHVSLTCSEDERHGVATVPDDHARFRDNDEPRASARAAVRFERCRGIVHTHIASELDAAVEQGFDQAAADNTDAWQRLWNDVDVEIDGDDRAQRYLRFCLYQVLAAAPRFTDRLSVPVKLLSGEYYQGNTFYDTDLYIVPVYTFTVPALARTCLNWRHQGLEQGRQIAGELGYQGAKFAWQAGPGGEECLGKWWRFTHTNVHINADVAYALMQYYWATGDEAFMASRGVELLVETARFFTSRVTHDPARDAYDMHDVAGPDEGHCTSTNNFYTNYLAIRNLRWAGQMLQHLGERDKPAYEDLVRRLQIQPDEPARWAHVADRLTLLFDPQSKVYEQCEGFFRLKPIPPDLLRNRQAWFAPVFPYQALNQPDVVMALVLFRDELDAEVRRANWEFYKDKSMNFSSMSFALNAIMAAEMGEMDEAYQAFLTCAGLDIEEELTGRGDTHAGLHGTAAGGAWMAAVFGFGGVCLSEKGLRINPRLPSAWNRLRFPLAYRGRRLTVSIDRQEVTVTTGRTRAPDIRLTVAGHDVTLRSGESCRVAYGHDCASQPDITQIHGRTP